MRCTRFAAPLALAAGLAAMAASASTFTVDFNPNSPVNTKGWDFGTTAFYTSSPGGVKMLPKNAGDTLSIESPVYANRIKAVSLSFKSVNADKTNTSVLVISGRTSATDQYREFRSCTGISGTLTTWTADKDTSTICEIDCHQIKVSYTKDSGALLLATVTLTDDSESDGGETEGDDSDGDTGGEETGGAAQLSPPTKLCATRKETGGTGEAFDVSWTLPSGIATSEYQVLEVTTSGGIDDSQPVWRETFAAVPARETAKQATAEMMSEWGLSAWGFETVYQKFEGALLVGGESDRAGALVTPPLEQSLESGHQLVVRANKNDTKTEGEMSVSRITGTTTNLIGALGLPLVSSLLSLQLPALAAGDRILLLPRAADGVKNHKTIVDEIAICKDFIAENVTTNEDSAIQTDETSLTVATAKDRTSLLFRIRSVSGDERSAWTETVQLDALASSGEAGDDDGDGETDDGATLAAPGDVRAGLLPDGRIRLGWTTPDGATNVTLRVWTLATEGGLAESEADDILWRETFVSAPATNSTSNILIDSDKELADYTDRGESGWNLSAFSRVYLSTSDTALRIGTTDDPGAIVSNPLGVSGDGLTLVVTAKRGTGEKNSGVILRPSLLSGIATTNTLGQTTVTADFAEYAFPISNSLTGDESLLLESVIDSPKDGRIILDDIALVRNYTSVQTVTNEVESIDLGADDDEHEFDAAEGVVRYAAFCAQDASGATSAWTETLTLDPDTLGEWKDRHLTLNSRGKVAATLDWTALPAATDAKLDVSDSPFRFLIDGAERLEISRNKDVTKSFSVGVYVCTNVFERDWIVLTPRAAETKADVRTAEMRVAIETGEFAVRRLAISGMFAQLGASNTDERALEFQWRCLVTDAATKVVTATDWQAFNGTSGFATTYTAADVAEDADFGAKLRETITNVTAEATLRLPDGTRPKAGARIEVRILNRRGIDQKEAPLGFREVSISAESGDSGALFLVH